MTTFNKEMLLADYLDGKISETELLLNHPELREDIELMKLSKKALGSLESMKSETLIDIPSDSYWFSRVPKIIWYAAASILILICISILFKRIEPSNTSGFIDFANSEETDIRLLGLWSIWGNTNINQSEQQQLLDLATKDENANIRFLALQKMIEKPLELSEPELFEFINGENNFCNQTAWLDLWIKMYDNKSKGLKQWLRKDDVNPLVKEYGDQLVTKLL